MGAPGRLTCKQAVRDGPVGAELGVDRLLVVKADLCPWGACHRARDWVRAGPWGCGFPMRMTQADNKPGKGKQPASRGTADMAARPWVKAKGSF